MVHRENVASAAPAQRAVDLSDARAGQVSLQGMAPKGDDHGWIEGVLLAVEISRTGADLRWFGIAVSGRAALHDVSDEYVASLPSDRAQQLGQQLARRSDERSPGRILSTARTFTDAEDIRVRISLSGHGQRPSLGEGAADTAADLSGDRGQLRLGAHRLELALRPSAPRATGACAPSV
jgi:hypothetical protein